jgi:DNA-binding transcriptional MerR regulator
VIPAYYRIGDVSRLLGEPTHVLRYWETTFSGVLGPIARNGGRQRYYSRTQVERLQQIRHLLRAEGYTCAGARRRLALDHGRGKTEAR